MRFFLLTARSATPQTAGVATVENYVSEPSSNNASYIAQHTLTLFLRRVTTRVERGNDDRRPIAWPDDTDVVCLIRPGTGFVGDPPAGRQAGRNPMLAHFRIQHPFLEP